MATRSTIGVQHEDGTISVIYCHWDGYLDHNGSLLVKHYNTLDRAEALVALGDVSSLCESIEQPEGHTFDTPVENHTIFYGRDRGEDGTQARTFKDYRDYQKRHDGEEYNYMFRDGKWECEADGKFYKDVAEELECMAEDDSN